MICLALVQLMLTTSPFKVDVMALLLIIEVKINFSLGFENTDYQTNKLQNAHALQFTLYTVHYVPHRPEFSTLETSQGRGHMGELLMLLISRLSWISTIGKFYSL